MSISGGTLGERSATVRAVAVPGEAPDLWSAARRELPESVPMTELSIAAPAFVAMAHHIVWATVSTVDQHERPRSRILHPYWRWDGEELVGWIGTGPTAAKRAHLEHSPYVSVNYWSPNHDTCTAECRATWAFDDETCERVWQLLKDAPAPVGYDPAIVPAWKDGPRSSAFAALRLDPWRLRVFPGTALLGGGGEVLTWLS
jgi:hypothetical protein